MLTFVGRSRTFASEMARKDRSNLTDRISIRFTPEEIDLLDKLADRENERKLSSLLRRIIISHLKDSQQKTNPPSDSKDYLAKSVTDDEEGGGRRSPSSSPRRR